MGDDIMTATDQTNESETQEELHVPEPDQHDVPEKGDPEADVPADGDPASENAPSPEDDGPVTESPLVEEPTQKPVDSPAEGDDLKQPSGSSVMLPTLITVGLVMAALAVLFVHHRRS